MTNMFSRAWSNKANTSVPAPIESQQIMGKVVPQSVVEKFEHFIALAPIVQSVPTTTQEPAPVIENLVATDINVATGPVEVDLSPIMEEKFIDIDTHEVVHHVVAPDLHTPISVHRDNFSYEQIIDDVNTTLQGIGTATTEDAYTYGINRLKNNKKPLPDDWIVGHIFGGSYDLWIHEYNEDDRTFFGFASFGSIDDRDAEWGDVSLDELLSIKTPIKLERDFYWTPCTLDSIKNKPEVRNVEGGVEIDIDVTDPAMRDLVVSVVDNPEALDEEPEEDTWSATKIKDKEQVKAIQAKSVCLAAGYWYTPLNAESPINWRLNEDITAYWNLELEEGDMYDRFFDSRESRDAFLNIKDDSNNAIEWEPIEGEIMEIGSEVTVQFEKMVEKYSIPYNHHIMYGVRYTVPKWKNGLTEDLAAQIVRDNYAKKKGLSAQELKDSAGEGGGTISNVKLSKTGISFWDSHNAKGLAIQMNNSNGEDQTILFTWSKVHKILNTEVVQEALPLPSEAQRIADEAVANELPFKKAEEPAKKTPDISWFYKPGYQKYAVAPRSSERKDRIVGNMPEEHGDNLQSLYQNFSGKGGLHEISYDDCANFNAYTEAKQEFEMGEFYTPDNIAEDMVKMLRIPATSNVIDATCGMGRFFNFIPHENRLYGYDKNYEALVAPRKLFENAHIASRDVFGMNLYTQHGTIQYSVGNPPFNIKQGYNWHHPLATQQDEEEGGKGILLSQDAYIFNTWNYLVDGGIAFFIVPESWLNGLRHTKVRDFINEKFFIIADLKLDKKAFAEYNVEFATKALLLVKKGEGISFDMDTYTGPISDAQSFLTSPQYEQYTKMKYKADHSVAEIALKKLRNEAVERDRRLYVTDKVRKAIYETFVGKPMATTGELTELQDPTKSKEYKEGIKNLERQKTELSILEVNTGSYQFDELMRKQALRLNKAISKPERVKVMEVSFEIARYDIIIKRSNNAVTEYFNKPEHQLPINGKMIWLRNKYTKNDLCTNDEVYEEFKATVGYITHNEFAVEYKDETRFITASVQKGLLAYVEKIRRLYKLNTLDTAKLAETYPVEYEENVEKLSELTFKEGTIKLLPHQVEDLAGVLLKRNALISWDTGLGKTLGGITWSKMKGGTTLVVAPAVNTIDPWYQQLQEYTPDASVMLLKNAKDIHKYKGQDYLIVSFESLPKIYKQLATFHFRNLILDESDNAKNKASKRFKSLRAIAKRFKNRLLMSGTPTRNNVNEIYNQLELLAQNSNAMMCWAREMVEYDRSTREWGTSNNPHYGEPFPAWGGHKAFENTFSPKKLTCFGAAETNQDIFNKDIFDELIRSIRFTRIFDVEKPRINAVLKMTDSGDYKEYKQVMVPMNATENKVYDYIMTDLADKLEEYYRAQHDGATASTLVIMQQIMKLMQGTSHPWTFEGYYDDEDVYHEVYDLDYNTSTKLEKACEIIDEVFKKPGINKVMMASPWRETDLQMSKTFAEKGYMVFRLTSEMSKHKRAELVAQFRAWPSNAIICGTMGCLKSGLNLPEVNTVIAESYPWNFAQLHQYAARAVRLNSTEKTEIYCLTSEGSFDVNVFSLILRKEVANTFVRTSEETSVEELSKDFGVESTDLFTQALQMVKEKTNGRTRGTIKWGSKATLENASHTTVTITHDDKEKFVKLAEVISGADESSLSLMNSLMTKSKDELLNALHSTDNPKFIGIINDTIRARFPE